MAPSNIMTSTLQNPKHDDARDCMTRIVRRHAHDVRNHLNVLDLDATLLGELISHPEAVATVRRMRTELTQLDETVKALLFKFDEPRPVVVAAGDLLQLWKLQATRLEMPGQSIEWSATHESKPLAVDANAVVSVLRELTLAAWRRASGLPLKASLHANAADAVVVELREPANDLPMPEDLMEESARLIQANGGTLDHVQNPATKEWLTTLTFAGNQPQAFLR